MSFRAAGAVATVSLPELIHFLLELLMRVAVGNAARRNADMALQPFRDKGRIFAIEIHFVHFYQTRFTPYLRQAAS